MSMRVNTIVTHLRAEDALTLIEFLDQVREVLAQTYGEDIRAMLQEASQRKRDRNEDEPF
ncbi:MAG: hypothetical protein HYS18_02485 [Burkholderiales bacterium]|nr:hypothetical protein [Burkholderiales bacterium]